ncbi:MAG: TonB-dependent receptor [Bacteroidaceae bacterium]|nr:TonB-dependent receptor [Bacteroidaceae bacterium]
MIITDAAAQTKLNGTVTTTKSEALADVSVVLMPKGSENVIGFTFTDDDGRFSLETAAGTDSLTLKVFGLNVEQVSRDIANRTQTVDFIVGEKVTELREVVVNEQKMWGGKDTINYAVSAFASEKDQVIGDVLKKMPGIDVKESGEITYQGKGINKFYIENLDLLQGRYGIATNNIAARDVATVQVLENHQPVRALEDVQFSDRAAINLKLKPEAKGTFSVNARVGAGATEDAQSKPQSSNSHPQLSFLRDIELAGMFFGRTYQNMTTLKSNNAGHDLTRELTQFNASSMPSAESYLSLRMPSPPGIDKGRWLRNDSHAATANNLFKLGKSAQLNVNVIGYTDKEDRESMAETSYLLPGTGTRVITEQMASVRRTDLVEGEVRYNLNEKMRYVNNYLRVAGQRQRSEGIILTPDRVEQALSQPSISIGDVFHYIHRTESGKGFETQTNIGYATSPSRLTVERSTNESTSQPVNERASQCQEMTTSTLTVNSTLALLSAFTLGHVKFTPRATVYYQNQQMTSELDWQTSHQPSYIIHQPLDPNLYANNSVFQHFRGMVSADLSYQMRRVKASLALPLSYNWLNYHDRLREGADKGLARVWLQPTASVQYEPATGWTLNASAGQTYQTGSPSTLYGGYILRNYRTLTRYDSRIACSWAQTASLNASYKDIFSMFFAGAGVRYSRSQNEVLYGQSFADENSLMATTTMIEMPTTSQRVSMTGDISKGFDWKKLLLKAGVEYGMGTSQYLQQNMVVDVVSNGLNVTGALSMQITRRLLIDWKGSYGTNQSHTRDGETLTPVRASTNRFSLNLPLFAGFDMTLAHEFYYNSATVGDDKTFSLTDAALSYKWKRTTWTLTCGNIFNTRSYVTAYHNAINTYYSAYAIRPANLLLKASFRLK